MRFRRFWMSLALLVVIGTARVGVAAEPGASQRRIEGTLRFLADDLLEGRGTPSRGLDISGLYLAEHLYAYGWEGPINGSYLQPFETGSFLPSLSKFDIRINGKKLNSDEYFFLPFSLDPRTTPLNIPIVFAGHGIYAPERGVDDFGKIDLKGKAVVSLQGAPWELDEDAPHSFDRVIGKSVPVTVQGGKCLIYVSEDLVSRDRANPGPDAAFLREMVHAPYAFLADSPNVATMGMGPVLAITPAAFDRVLSDPAQGDYRHWKESLSSPGFSARELPASLSVAVQADVEIAPASNVVGIRRGTDPALRNQWIVISAHYDHLGFKTVPKGEDGIWNGADDNGSGTASVLELARLLSESPPLKRSVLILFTAGEDRGMLGSAYYVNHPVVPLDQVVADINIDMVGRSDGTLTAYTEGGPELFEMAGEAGSRNGLRVTSDQHPSWRVLYFLDSYHFARYNVPFIELFTQMHADYHQPSDEIQLIHFEELTRITDIAFDVVRRLGDSSIRPTFKAPSWFVTPVTE